MEDIQETGKDEGERLGVLNEVGKKLLNQSVRVNLLNVLII